MPGPDVPEAPRSEEEREFARVNAARLAELESRIHDLAGPPHGLTADRLREARDRIDIGVWPSSAIEAVVAFEQTMLRIRALADLGPADVQRLHDRALEVGRSLTIEPRDLLSTIERDLFLSDRRSLESLIDRPRADLSTVPLDVVLSKGGLSWDLRFDQAGRLEEVSLVFDPPAWPVSVASVAGAVIEGAIRAHAVLPEEEGA